MWTGQLPTWNSDIHDSEESSVCVGMTVLLPTLLAMLVAWFGRRWWARKFGSGSSNTPTHAVSRRRKVTRDPSRRPPPLPVVIRDRGQTKREVAAQSTPQQSEKHTKKVTNPTIEDLTNMPGSRRNLPRSNVSRSTVASNDDPHKIKLSSHATEVLVPKAVCPKHIPIPKIPQDSELLFETIMFVYTFNASFLQFLHLYRTVFWLPQSYTRYAMNIYLVDPYLVGFIVTIQGRRLVYCILSCIIRAYCPLTLRPLVIQILRLILLAVVVIILSWCTYFIMQNHPVVNIFYLCYPISVYFILFGLNIGPFFDVSAVPSAAKEELKGKSLGKLYHSCSMSPPSIRDEVEILKTDFNNRMKQVLFSSVLNAYYAGFVPMCFAQGFLYYDVYWATQHLGFVWVGCFTMYIVHCYPVKYCDVLHRAALHLGKWARVEGRTPHIPSQLWADAILWHQGALVKHLKELYKAEGISNAAEPGSTTHARFYAIFNNPSVLLCSLLGLQFTLVFLQLIILIRSSEWHHIFSLALLLFTNYYTLFKLARDYLISWKVYKAEQLIQEKVAG